MTPRLVRRMPPAGYHGDCGCGGMPRVRQARPVASTKARGGATKLRRTKDGKLVSRRSKTGNPACSAAASLLALGKHTADSQAVLGRCRAQARHARDARIRRDTGDEVGAARAERRARRGLTDKETRERLAAAREKRTGQIAGRGVPSPKPARTESPKPSRTPSPAKPSRKPATTTATTRGTPSPALAARHALSPEERITALYRKTQQRLAGDHDTPEIAARYQARLDAAAARFAALPTATQVAVATRLVGPAAGKSGASARRALETQFDRVNTTGGRSREISNFDRAGAREIRYGVVGSFPNTAPARISATARARASAAEDARRARQSQAARQSEPPPATPKVAAAETRAMELQATARQRMPDDIDRDVDRLIDSLTAAEARILVHRVVGVDVGKTKKAAKEALAKRIDDVRASHDRSAEILTYKSLGGGDEGGDGDGPFGDEAMKAARGGRRKRDKGGRSADRVPPAVSAAARRVAKGRGTSEDQKLLRAWERRKKGGPIGAYLERPERRELARDREKLRGVEKDWQARLDKHELSVQSRRSALVDRLRGRPDADARLAAFDRKAAESRPSRQDHEEFVHARTSAAFDDASHAYGQARANRADFRGRATDGARIHAEARRYGVEFVARHLPPSIRSDPDPLRFLPVDDLARDIYRERGGTIATARESGPVATHGIFGYRETRTVDDPALMAGAEAEARQLWVDALAKPARRAGTKAIDDLEGPDDSAESGPAAGDE